MAEKEQISFFQDLWDRRFFQFIGTYLGVGFALVQFAEFLENRYGWQNNLVEKVLLFVAVLFPAVIVFVYNHGRKGDDQWLPFEKIFIPTSLIAALSLSLFMFNQASPQTAEVSIIDESGQTVKRTIPSAASAKRLALFPWASEVNDTANVWLEAALPWLMRYDLEQDMRTFGVDPYSMKDEYDNYEIAYLSPVSFGTQLKIAQDNYTDYFVSGTLLSAADDISCAINVYHTNTGKLFYEDTVSGPDVFTAIDEFTRDFHEHLYLKEGAFDEEYIDLPVSNLVSSKPEAIKNILQGLYLSRTSPDQVAPIIQRAALATQIDPQCAECFSYLANFYLVFGKEEEASQAIAQAMRKAELLPERQRLSIGYINYLFDERIDQAKALLSNWQKLYPSDQKPYVQLMNFHQRALELDQAKEVGKLAIENGHRGNILIKLARLYIQTEDYDEAEKYLDKFANLYPHLTKSKAILGEIYIAQGEFQKAKKFYEDLQLVKPNEVDFTIKLADIYNKLGQFDESEQILKKALSTANTGKDSTQIIENLEQHYDRLGRYSDSFAWLEQRKKILSRLYPELYVLNTVFNQTWTKFLLNGREQDFRESFARFRALLPGRSALLNCQEKYTYAVFREDVELLKALGEECVQTIYQTSGTHYSLLFDAITYQADGDYANAVQKYESFMDSTGLKDPRLSVTLSKLYRLSGQIDKAQSLAADLMQTDPHEPIFLLEAAKVAWDAGEKEAAKETLNKTLDIWSQSDTSYQYFQDALTFRQEINAQN